MMNLSGFVAVGAYVMFYSFLASDILFPGDRG
jgi:hypothetical protein